MEFDRKIEMNLLLTSAKVPFRIAKNYQIDPSDYYLLVNYLKNKIKYDYFVCLNCGGFA